MLRPDILFGSRKEGWLEGSDIDSLLAVGPMELLPAPVTEPILLQEAFSSAISLAAL